MASGHVLGVDALERRLKAISGPATTEAMAKRLGLSTVREAKLLVHRKTGNLGRSIHVVSATPSSVKVVASAHYAADLEFGTRPHEIKPRVRKALRWAAAGQRRLSGAPRSGATGFFFATVVHHPGTKPYPFLLPGARIAVKKSGLDDMIVERWNGAA